MRFEQGIWLTAVTVACVAGLIIAVNAFRK
jgi:hypothetical protein